MAYETGYGGSSRAVASPLFLHETTISRPTLPTLMWGEGAGTLASILLPMAMGELKGMIASLERSSSSEDGNNDKGGGRRSSSPNILRLTINDISQLLRIHSTKLNTLFPRGEQYMV